MTVSSLVQRARIPRHTTTFFASTVDDEGRGEPIEVSFNLDATLKAHMIDQPRFYSASQTWSPYPTWASQVVRTLDAGIGSIYQVSSALGILNESSFCLKDTGLPKRSVCPNTR